jgi:hypothetical protein
MGMVKIDTHKAEYQFQRITLSDIDCIKGLIKNRWMIDEYFESEINTNIYSAGDVKPLNQELICTYLDLDNLIKKAKLNDKQLAIIHMLMQGWTEEDIADEYKQDVTVIQSIFDTACEKIKKINDYEWKYNYIYMNKKKVEWDYKKCSKCGESKPKTDEFFRERSDSKDGFRNECRECEVSAKKMREK